MFGRVILMLSIFTAVCMNSSGAVHYVSLSGTNNAPYTNWADAATNIQHAVNVAVVGDTVLVSNGTYYLTDNIAISSAITVTSVNGREVTIVDGNNYKGKFVTNRCFYVSGSGVTLDGFTIRNGCTYYSGGGIVVYGSSSVINCRITGNVSTGLTYGGGVSLSGSGIVMSNCEVVGNYNYAYGGAGVYMNGKGEIRNCTIASNVLRIIPGFGENHRGAGLFAAGDGSGGISVTIDCCVVYGNVITNAGGKGAVGLIQGVLIRNSFINNNFVDGIAGGLSLYASSGGKSMVQNCTIASNYASSDGGGIFVQSAAGSTTIVRNVVCYYNSSAGVYSNFKADSISYTGVYQIVNSCIAPTNAFPTSGVVGYYYSGNIESNPQFVNKDAGNFRLSQNSPCINTGTNQDWMTNAVDLDGRTRIRYGTVDMGAYETIYEGTIYRMGF